MSTTIAHRRHVHHRLPWLSIVVLIVAIAVAAVVIYAVNQPTTTTGTAAEAVVQPASPPMVMPQPDNYAFMRRMMLANQLGGAAKAQFRIERHNFIEGR